MNVRKPWEETWTAEQAANLRAFRHCRETKSEALDRIKRHGEWCHIHGGMDVSCSMTCLVRKYLPDDMWEKANEDLDQLLWDEVRVQEGVHGIPESVRSLSEEMVYLVPGEMEKSWTQSVFAAIPEGADLCGVMDRFSAWCIGDEFGRRRAGEAIGYFQKGKVAKKSIWQIRKLEEMAVREFSGRHKLDWPNGEGVAKFHDRAAKVFLEILAASPVRE